MTCDDPAQVYLHPLETVTKRCRAQWAVQHASAFRTPLLSACLCVSAFRMSLLSACLCLPQASAFRKTTRSDAALHFRTLHSHLLPRADLPRFLRTTKPYSMLCATADHISPRCRGLCSESMCQKTDQKAGRTSLCIHETSHEQRTGFRKVLGLEKRKAEIQRLIWCRGCRGSWVEQRGKPLIRVGEEGIEGIG